MTSPRVACTLFWGPPSREATADATAFALRSRFKRRLERVKGIEPSCAAWEAAVLPLNYTRVAEEGNGDR
jgi:hypothetical protein